MADAQGQGGASEHLGAGRVSRDLGDYTGHQFGSWTVLGRAEWPLSGPSTWHVMCLCGETDIRASSEIKSLTACPECLAWEVAHEVSAA